MKKQEKKFVLAAVVLLAITGLLALAGCKNDSVPETPAAKLVSISVIPPTRTVYSEGQSFDPTGMKVTATYTVRKLEGITVTTLPAQTVYSERQSFDPTGMVVTATYDDKSQREVTGWETDFNTVAGEKGLNKPVTVSYTEGETPKTTTFTVTVFPAEVKVLTGYTSSHAPEGEWTYVAFGKWPQSEAPGVNPTQVTPQSENLFKDKYYFDANGEYVKEGDKYYKVEPIVWRVLTEDYKDPYGNSTSNALLLAEKILTGGIPYYVDLNTRTITGAGTKEGDPNTVYPNNWQYSTIRAWLNGLDVVKSDDAQKNDTTYTGKGFLQTAFTQSARDKIAYTTVDNSAASTNPASNSEEWNSGENEYACGKTTDKVFLLSEKEATTGAHLKADEDYGFDEYSKSGKGNTRIRVTTDYAKATGAYQDSTEGYGGWWWLRSPDFDIENLARVIRDYGLASSYNYVNVTNGGVVPALSISLQ